MICDCWWEVGFPRTRFGCGVGLRCGLSLCDGERGMRAQPALPAGGAGRRRSPPSAAVAAHCCAGPACGAQSGARTETPALGTRQQTDGRPSARLGVGRRQPAPGRAPDLCDPPPGRISAEATPHVAVAIALPPPAACARIEENRSTLRRRCCCCGENIDRLLPTRPSCIPSGRPPFPPLWLVPLAVAASLHARDRLI